MPKMAEKCKVPGCKTKRSEKVTFFAIPSNFIMKKAWENRIGVNLKPGTDHICAKHFLMKDVCTTKGSSPKLRVTAMPKMDGQPINTPTATVEKKIKVRKFAQDIPVKQEIPESYYNYDPNSYQSVPTTQATTSTKKSKKKKASSGSVKKGSKTVDPLDIKTEAVENDLGLYHHSTVLSGCMDYNETENFFGSDMGTRNAKPLDRLAMLEEENLQLKTKYSQLINDYVQMKTEKIQLKAELDEALAANQKLIIVKNSLVTTIQTLGKMSDVSVRANGMPVMMQMDATAEVSDTIIGF